MFKFGSSLHSDQFEKICTDVLTIFNNLRRPSMEKIGAYKETSPLFWPTCRKPRRDKVVKAAEEDIVVLRCLNCDTVLAPGVFIGFRVFCPN
jgi:hypothetical protein